MATLRTVAELRQHLELLGVQIPCEPELESADSTPLGASLTANDALIGNRFCILPMEGWDGTRDGRPTAHTYRRWERFGLSGAKLIWGGEAVAIEHAGRANPHQLMINDDTLDELALLRKRLENAHFQSFGTTEDLYIGLQLTHSGRFARPNDNSRIEPRVMYHHSELEKRFNVPGTVHVLTDVEVDALIGRFIHAAKLAALAGFQFVDIKHCHGYLGHEMLSAFDRPGRYGGTFENRTRFIRTIVERIHDEIPALQVGVRFSAFDWAPFEADSAGTGHCVVPPTELYRTAFGGDGTPTGIDLAEPFLFLKLLEDLGVRLVCTSAGSPYYNPHIQRPALFPPSDGYQPPEDPLIDVARQIQVTSELKQQFPNLVFVGSGYSYLQEWLPKVGQATIRAGMVDFVGLGRMVLSYPELPADVLSGQPLKRRLICRTFSDCTTAPRNGMISGCFPLDEYYAKMPIREQLVQIKQQKNSTQGRS